MTEADPITAAPPVTPNECPGCGRGISRNQFGCRSCWFKLPPELRRRVWANYRRPIRERINGLPELYSEAMTVWSATP